MTRIFSARWLRRVLVVGGVIGALLAGVAAARAHALLIGATPAENSQLTQAPAQIELFFSEPLESALSTIEVFDEAGSRRDIDGTRLDPADPTRLTVSLRALPAGQYSVVWRVASTTDGHVTEGGYAFSVGPAAVLLAPRFRRGPRQIRLRSSRAACVSPRSWSCWGAGSESGGSSNRPSGRFDDAACSGGWCCFGPRTCCSGWLRRRPGATRVCSWPRGVSRRGNG